METQDLFKTCKAIIARDPCRWHTVVGIDTATLSRGQGTPNFVTGEGDDRLHTAPSFKVDGAVRDRHEDRVYDAIDAYVAKGIASNKEEAARMILELY